VPVAQGPGFSFMRKIFLRNSHQNGHSPKIKMAADLAASHLIDFIDYLAPQVGLEPTTLRLTAIEFADPPAAIGCYKPLYKIRLRLGRKLRTAIHTAWIATDFE
jgi:hypothetical protein